MASNAGVRGIKKWRKETKIEQKNYLRDVPPYGSAIEDFSKCRHDNLFQDSVHRCIARLILEDVYSLSAKVYRAKSSRKQQGLDENWIESESEELFSFRYCCTVLGLDVRATRKALRRIIEDRKSLELKRGAVCPQRP